MRDDKNMIFFTRYWCARHTAVDLSIHLPPGRMTVKNSDRFDNIGQWEEKAAPRLCSIVKHFYHFLCSEIVVYFFSVPSSDASVSVYGLKPIITCNQFRYHRLNIFFPSEWHSIDHIKWNCAEWMVWLWWILRLYHSINFGFQIWQ